jgi:hypothetical protein
MKQSEQAQARVWRAGVPTAPDVDAMMARWGSVKIGDVIAHSEIERAIGARRSTDRYQTVVTAFRRRLERDQNVVLGAVPGVGYKVLSDAERVDAGYGKLATSGRAVRRAGTLAQGVESQDLTPEYRARATHLVAVSATIAGAMRTQAKRLARDLSGIRKVTAEQEGAGR